jgi:glycosyltransferase involved in cell wall biosynthesis
MHVSPQSRVFFARAGSPGWKFAAISHLFAFLIPWPVLRADINLFNYIAFVILNRRYSFADARRLNYRVWPKCYMGTYIDVTDVPAAGGAGSLCVSAIVSCYNLEREIREGIESVLAQTALDRIHEIIVVDDGSRDRSREIISELARKHPVIRPLFKENGGASSARNAGIAASKSPYIAFLDGDDLWMPEKLARQLPYIEQNPEAGILFCDFEHERADAHRIEIVYADDYTVDHSDPLRTFFLQGGTILPTTSLIRRDVFDVVGGFDEDLKYCNDGEMWTRVANAFPMVRTPGILARKREVDGSISSNIEKRLEAMHEISERVYAMRPDLRRYDRRRRSRLEIQAGLGWLLRKDGRGAWKSFARATMLDPVSARNWSYLILTSLPGRPDWWLGLGKSLLAHVRAIAGGRAVVPPLSRGRR